MLPVFEFDDENFEGTLNTGDDVLRFSKRTETYGNCSKVYFEIGGDVYGGLKVDNVDNQRGYLISSIDGSLGQIVSEKSEENAFEELLEEVRENAVLSYLEQEEYNHATLNLQGKTYNESIRKPETSTKWVNHSFNNSSLETSEGKTIISGQSLSTDRFR